MTTTQWWAELTYPPKDDLDDDTLDNIMAALPGFTMLHQTPAGLRVETTIDAGGLMAATTAALAAAGDCEKAGLGQATGIRVLTAEQRDIEIAHPDPVNLVGVTEIADLLGVTRQRASAVTELPDFPHPIGTARGGRYWTTESVDRFAERWQRQPGRPVKP